MLALSILIPGIAFLGVCGVLSNFFNSTGRAYINSIVVFIAGLLQLFFTIIFLTKWGIIGAVYSILLSFFIHGLLNILLFKYISKCRYDELVPKPDDLKFIYDFAIILISNKKKNKLEC